MALTRRSITEMLRRLGIQEGDVVLFHSSFKSLGPVEGGPDAVIDAFLDAVGPSGTVAVPTIIHTGGLPRGDIFHPDTAPSEVGILTEFLRKRPGAYRSWHRTHSVAAIGARAEELTRDHPQATGGDTPWGPSAFGIGSPWDKLYRWDAKYLFLGVYWNVCTLFHYAQARYVEALQPGYAKIIPFPYFTMRRVGEKLEAEGHVTKGRIGEAEVRICRASVIVDRALECLRQNPLELFEDQSHPFCQWVRNTLGKSLTLRGGFGRAPILPEAPSEAQNLDSDARLLVLENDLLRLAIVGLPILHLFWPEALGIRERVGEEMRVPLENVLVACEHRHMAAVNPYGAEGARHFACILDATAYASRQARERIQPVRLGVAQRNVEGVSRIRRVRMSDGKVYSIRRAVPSTWNWATKSEYVGPDDELDSRLTVLRVEAADRRALGAVFIFGCHPIPDFLHYAAQKVERYFGGDFVCLGLRGAQGNVDAPFEREIGGRRFDAQLEPLGEIMTGALLETFARAHVDDGGSLAVEIEPIHLPLDPRVAKSSEPEGASAFPQIQRAIRTGGFDLHLQCMRLGPLALLALPGEPEVRVGRAIESSSLFPMTRVLSLANGTVGYILSPESRAKDGYEADPRLWGICADESEMILRRAAHLCLCRMYQREIRGKG